MLADDCERHSSHIPRRAEDGMLIWEVIYYLTAELASLARKVRSIARFTQGRLSSITEYPVTQCS